MKNADERIKVSRVHTEDQIQSQLDRLRRVDKELRESAISGICSQTTERIQTIQDVRYRTGWKAYLGLRATLHAIREKRMSRLMGCLVKRDREGLKNAMIAEDWLRQLRNTLVDNERALYANTESYQQLIQEQQDAILALIDAYHAVGRNVFLMMAPYFTKERLADGYFQRVQAVDGILAPSDLKIYASWLDADEVCGVPRVFLWDQTHMEIRYPHPDSINDARILQIARRAGVVYHHSITFANGDVTKDAAIQKIFDMHGAYPEELRMYGREQQATIDEAQEGLAMQHGQCLVCVTKSMMEHLKQKYGSIPEKVILLPILDEKRLRQCLAIEKKQECRMTVVYAGGMQKWQNVKMMQDAIHQTQDRFSYRIFTPSPEAFWKQWKHWWKPKNLEVCAKTPDEVIKAYASCDYGFMLRDDIVVNRVACPTKLVEYLAAGIIPILTSTRIGDFVQDGMAYLSLEDLVKGKLPTGEERDALVQQNLRVVQKLEERFRTGKEQLRDWMTSKSDERVAIK